jgi:hypothetical protein
MRREGTNPETVGGKDVALEGGVGLVPHSSVLFVAGEDVRFGSVPVRLESSAFFLFLLQSSIEKPQRTRRTNPPRPQSN